jgi:hypothetical protein
MAPSMTSSLESPSFSQRIKATIIPAAKANATMAPHE